MRSQPQGVTRVSPASPLARGLESAATLAGHARDAVGGLQWGVVNGTVPLTYGVSTRGRGMLSIKASTPSYVSRPQPPAITASPTQPLTFCYRLVITTMPGAGVASGLLQWADTAASGAPRYYARLVGQANGTGVLDFYFMGGYRGPSTVLAGVEYIVTHAFDGATHRIYLNGALVNAFGGTWTDNAGSFYLGRGFGTPEGAFLLSDFAAWSRALSAAEAKTYADNPWQIFDAGPSGNTYRAAIAAGTSAPTTISASIAWAEAGDTVSIAGLLTNRIAAAWSEAGDTSTLGAVITNRATSAWTEGDDSTAAAGVVTDRGALTWAEDGDNASLSGSVQSAVSADLAAVLAWTEAGDSASLVARLTNLAALATSEQGDSWALAARIDQPAAVTISVRFDVLPRNFALKTIHFSN